MAERDWSERTGEFGDDGNPPGAKAPNSPASGEFGGEGNPPGLRPQDAEREREGEVPRDAERPA